MNKIDWKRFANGQRQLRVEGVASTKERKELDEVCMIYLIFDKWRE